MLEVLWSAILFAALICAVLILCQLLYLWDNGGLSYGFVFQKKMRMAIDAYNMIMPPYIGDAHSFYYELFGIMWPYVIALMREHSYGDIVDHFYKNLGSSVDINEWIILDKNSSVSSIAAERLNNAVKKNMHLTDKIDYLRAKQLYNSGYFHS